MFTNAMNRAHGDILRGFNLALEKYATVPLGHDAVNPKTLSRRQTDAIKASLNPTLPMNSDVVGQRTTRKPNNPRPMGGQSEKNRAAGKVVDPSAIETAQAADSVSVDASSGHGITNVPFLD